MITRRQAIRAVLILLVVLAAVMIVRRRAARPASQPRLTPVLTIAEIPTDRSLDSFTVAPDGGTLAYSAEGPDGRLHLFVQPSGGTESRELAAAAGARDPFFAPDGKWLAYFSHDAIWRVPLAGGAAQRI